MPASIQELYVLYRKELKPLIAEYESQNERFVISWLIELSQMFDRVALCETEVNPNDRIIHLKKAAEHLNQAISDGRRAVVSSMMNRVVHFKKRYGKDTINRICDGKFVGPFYALEKEVRQVKDSNEMLAYVKLSEMINMIQKSHASILANSLAMDGKFITWLKWIVTVLVTLITSYLITLLW